MSEAQPPILDFDPNRNAIIEPSALHQRIDGLPNRCVITWMGDAFERFEKQHGPVERYRLRLESGSNPIYQFEVDGEQILVAIAHVGAPVAAALFEALIAIGCDTFVAVGSSGGLVPELAPGAIVVPDAAIRDEGVSYHYAQAADLAHPDAELQGILLAAFRDAGYTVASGTVWTTDAFFRETADKVAKRVGQGAIAVDMEAASFAAIADFRDVRLGHAVYVADTLHSAEWDSTELVDRDTNFRYQLLMTAAAACATL